jgi:hypothetical protein
MEAFHACLNGADVQVVVKLRHGIVELQGIKEDKYIVLYRHNVEPMCPQTAFGERQTNVLFHTMA